MEAWMWVIVALLIAFAVIWFVMLAPDMKKVVDPDRGDHGHGEAHHAPVASVPAGDRAAVAHVLGNDAGRLVAIGAGTIDEPDAVARARHGVVFDVPDAAGAFAGSSADEEPRIEAAPDVPAGVVGAESVPLDESEAAPTASEVADGVLLGEVEHESSVAERVSLGDAPHGGGESSAHGAEPVPYVSSDFDPEAAPFGLDGWRAAAQAVPAVEQVWDGPFGPGSAEPAEDGSGPAGWTVKAARQSKVYLTPEVPVYEAARATVWFVDEQRAIDAGFRRWDGP